MIREKIKSKNKIKGSTVKKIGIGVIILILIIVLAICIYLFDIYEADEESKRILDEGEYIIQDKYIELDVGSDMGIIFYPGGKVEYEAYLPILKKLSDYGINIYLVEMPFNLAIFNENAADDIINNNPEIREWYLMGHSLGGVTGSNYAKDNEDKITGLILLGSYNYAEFAEEKTLTIYGENDLLMAQDIEYDINVYEIEGGNHAQFGNYGIQDGDGVAEITTNEQQDIAISIILEFIGKTESIVESEQMVY